VALISRKCTMAGYGCSAATIRNKIKATHEKPGIKILNVCNNNMRIQPGSYGSKDTMICKRPLQAIPDSAGNDPVVATTASPE